MQKERWIRILIILIIGGILSFFVFFSSSFAIQTSALNQNELENLKLKAQVECLQNSQCSGSQECLGNQCVEKSEIDSCKNVGLSTASRNLKEGDSINSVKRVLTRIDLPYLLSDGELVDIVDGKAVEYFYSPIITVGDNKIEKENGDYIIKNDGPLYTYKLTFSNPVDFSNKNIHGQVLKILGEEYLIGKNSDNSNIELISKNKNLKLKDADNIKITHDENRNVLSIEIDFDSLNKIKVRENYSDSLLNKTKLSFDNFSGEFADVKIGGIC